MSDVTNNCVICEEELHYDEMGYSMHDGGAILCTNKHCNVGANGSNYDTGAGHFIKLNKPLALSAEGWCNWDALAKKQHPFRYWLTDTVSTALSVSWRINFTDRLDWIRYRTYNRYHRINTGLKPGWSDVSEQMLSTNFTMLVDFIEIEKAHMMAWSYEDHKSTQKWWQKGPFNNYRDAAEGLKHLEWEMKLIMPCVYGSEEDGDANSLTPQAESAKEQFELYNWWKARPDRPDAMDASGMTDWYDRNRGAGFMESFTLHKKAREHDEDAYKKMNDLHYEIEARYEKEDKDNLIRLVSIRQSLWT
jgi:hypothetical protein